MLPALAALLVLILFKSSVNCYNVEVSNNTDNLNFELLISNDKVEEYLLNLTEMVSALPNEYLNPLNMSMQKLLIAINEKKNREIAVVYEKNYTCENHGTFSKRQVGFSEMDELKLQLCAEFIRNGKIDKAITTLNSIREKEKFLKRIVFEVFDGEIKNFGSILAFSEKLENGVKFSVLWHLLNEIIINSNLNDFLRTNDLLKALLKSDTSALTTQQQENAQMMKNILQAVSKRDEINISETEFRHYIDGYSKYGSISPGNDNTIVEIMEKFIYEKYLEFVNYSFLLFYVENFENLALKGIGLRTLIKMIKTHKKIDSKDTLRVASTLKSLMDSPEFASSSEDIKALFLEAKHEFPELVQNVIWESVCLRNIHYSKYYIYAENDTKFQESPSADRRVFAWKKSNQPKNAEWKFETNDKGKSFYMKSVNLNEFYYPSTETYPGHSTFRKTFSQKSQNKSSKDKIPSGPEFKWRLELFGSATKLGIMNIMYNEALHVDSTEDANRMRVFTWLTKGSYSTNGYFLAENCASDL